MALKKIDHLLIINYALDDSQPIFATSANWISELCKKHDRVTVITGHLGKYDKPKNAEVYSINWVESQNFRNVVKTLVVGLKVIRRKRFSVAFTHMALVQALILSPLLKLYKIRHVVWYAHASNPITLRITKKFASEFVTSTTGSFPLKSAKVTTIGQGIDPSKFSKKSLSYPMKNLIHVGRFEKSKNIDFIIETVAHARAQGFPLTFTQVGNASTKSVGEYEFQCKEKFSGYVEEGWLHFEPTLSHEKIPEVLSNADLFIHAFQGSLDKTTVEAVLMGLPLVSINHEVNNFFGDKLINASLLSRLLTVLSFDEKSLKNYAEVQEKLAIENGTLDVLITKLDKILISGNSSN
jgi:glycosyltransferase involved in cell wall biosynthesis